MIKKLLKNKQGKDYRIVILISILTCFIIHLPLLTKNILTADVLLNNGYYSSYSWEISLGRFGLYFIGLLKSFLIVPHIELFISFILIGLISVLIIDIFQIKNIYLQLLTCFIISICPNISATLLFNYCSLAYTIAFLTSILSVYILIKANNKYIKYLVPIILIVISESIYQSYIQVTITLLLLYYIKSLLENRFNIKECIKNVLIIILSMLTYFISMKLSLLIFNINLSSYSGASSFSINNILNIPNQIIKTYITFYNYYFKDTIINNTYIHNNIINIFLFLIFFIDIIYIIIKNKVKSINIIVLVICILLLPITLNSIILIIPDTKMQTLMSMSYIIIIPFILSLSQDNTIIKYLIIIITILLLRNYTIQDCATYQTLENTYNKTYKIASNIVDHINKLGYDKQIMITGNLDNNKYYNYSNNLDIEKLHNLNYGFVSNSSLFWNEYVNTKNGWTKFMYEYLGVNINFVDSDKYNKIINSNTFKKMEEYPSNKSIKQIDDIIVIKLN